MSEIQQHRRAAGQERSDDPHRPAPFVPDEADAPKDPDTGEIRIDEPDLGDPPPEEPEVEEQ